MMHTSKEVHLCLTYLTSGIRDLSITVYRGIHEFGVVNSFLLLRIFFNTGDDQQLV